MYNTPKTIKEAYDIATAFIIDCDTELQSHANHWCVVYDIAKTFPVNEQTYYLEINIPRNMPKKTKNFGSLTLYQFNNDKKHTLFNVKTKHTVGQILRDYTHPTHTYELKILIEKFLSYRFYKIIKLIELRTTARLTRRDTSAEICQHICRIKESQR